MARDRGVCQCTGKISVLQAELLEVEVEVQGWGLEGGGGGEL